MTAVVLAHFLVGLTILAVGVRVPRLAVSSGVVVLLTAFIAMIALSRRDEEIHETWTWIGDLGLTIDLRLDGFAVVMGLVVSGLGALILAYAAAYFDHDRTFNRFAGVFVLFAGAMTGLVLSADLFTMFVFWEMTSLFSFLLIGLDDRSEKARKSALRALLTTGMGGLALLGAVALFQVEAGTTSFAALAESPPAGAVVNAALVLVLLAAFTKSAQFPFHFWLPGAMAAPTPVSAYLHSATMVKAGIVLVARMAPIFGDREFWRWSIVVCGGLTMMIGGLRALKQNDIKLLLAFGTVSQLGFMMILFGLGTPSLTYAGVAHLVAHAIFKAGLFLGVGVVDHTFGSRDITVLSGVGRKMKWLAALAVANALSMAGVIPLLGFATKEKALVGLIDSDHYVGGLGNVALVVVVLGSVVTVMYTLRFISGTFGRRSDAVDSDVRHRPGWLLVGPIVLLAGLSIIGGLVPGVLGDLVRGPAKSLDAAAKGHLVLWPGVNAAFLTSLGILAGGVALWRATRRLEWNRTIPIDGERAYDVVYESVLSSSRRVTAVSQTGSLVVYLVATMTVVLAALVVAIFWAGDLTVDGLVIADSWQQALIVLGVCAASIALVIVRHRFVSAAMLGVVGFGVAVLFALHGAPDLALTQLLVETLTLVVFLLVLRQMPRRFDPSPSWVPRVFRLVVSLAVGAAMTFFALQVFDARTGTSVGEEYAVLSEPEAGGRNIVNVILVDFRGFDTLGEITVLAIAAIGVMNLVRMAQRQRRIEAASADEVVA
ncbi:MAG: hydrogen gas-evolving membrane-bound hydrogenase subunit E [Ilumatobacteraceae bacterium]